MTQAKKKPRTGGGTGLSLKEHSNPKLLSAAAEPRHGNIFKSGVAGMTQERPADTRLFLLGLAQHLPRHRVHNMHKPAADAGRLAVPAPYGSGGAGVNVGSQSRKLTAAITISVMNADINAMSMTSPAMIRSPYSGRPHSRRGLMPLLQVGRKAAAGCQI